VLVVIVATVLGGFVVAGALPAPDVRALTVGDVLTVRPLPGWEVGRRQDTVLPAPGAGTIRGSFAQLTRGSGALDLLALPALGGTAEGAAILYADQVLASQLSRISVSDPLDPIVLRSGLEAVRFGYIGTEPQSGAAIEGTVTAAVSRSGNAVVFDGWAPEGQLPLIAEELAVMTGAAEVA
jgi:hypothetical protein